ncbi:cytochrome b5 domain-containing protein 1-like, partial [Asbolus verrucosus]
MNVQNNKKLPVYAPFEVIIHNTSNDCWVSFLGKVFNLTALIKRHRDDDCIKSILAFAGKDISHWFDERTGEIQHFIHPVTGVEVPYCPHGRLPDVSYEVPSVLWRPLEGNPWWKNDNYMDKLIDMDKTMDENGIPDEREKMTELGIPKSYFIPIVRLYYNDDLKHFEDLSDDDKDETDDICCVCRNMANEKNKFPVYAPFEVIIHNTPRDCWLSFLGKVFDVTPVVKNYKNEKYVKPILAFAGKDVSHWFDEKTGEIQQCIHPVTGVEVPYCPQIPEMPYYDTPSSLWSPILGGKMK